MHWNTEQILWALVLAGHLVLLIVLLGRDRTSRFPWFTAFIALSTARLIVDHLLHGKLTSIAFYWQSYTSMLLDAILGLCVLIEVSRAVFSSAKAGLVLKARGWLGWILVTLALAAAAVWAWGPWPAWAALKSQQDQLPLVLVLISALKAQLLVALLAFEVSLLLLIFARRFGFGWKSHPLSIAIGLSTNAIGFLSLQVTTELMRRHVHFTTPQERQQVALRLNHLFANLDNAHYALWFLVLLWWSVWLWRDETPIPALVSDSAKLNPESPIPTETSAIQATQEIQPTQD